MRRIAFLATLSRYKSGTIFWSRLLSSRSFKYLVSTFYLFVNKGFLCAIWMTTVSIKFSDIESIKILYEPTKRVCMVKHMKSTSQNNTMT